MARNIRRLAVLGALTAVLLLAIVLLAFSYTELGVTDEIGATVLGLDTSEYLAVPPSVLQDATGLSIKLFGDSQDKYRDFVNQLVATYVEARDKDFVVLFNPGGWGWSPVDSAPGWHSILNGMDSELDDLGYTSLLLDYRRTSQTVRGRIKELVEIFTDYPSKAGDLAYRVKFLTDHIPDLKVIIAGESNGTVISDSAMDILRDNPQVYSIQTGPPFWEKPKVSGRTLVLRSNGTVPDSFSYANIPTLFWSNLKALLGLSSSSESPGRILYHLRAPGHDYSWQYPKVSSQIVKFLEDNFGIKRG